MGKTASVDDRTIRSLLTNPALLVAVPELRTVVKRPAADPYCRPCRDRGKGPKIDFAKAKQVVAGLSGSRLAAVKAALQVDRLALIVPTHGGRTSTVVV